MHQLPKTMLQVSPIPIRCTKIRILNIEGTPSSLLLKSTDEKKNSCGLSGVSLVTFFIINMKLQQLQQFKIELQTFKGIFETRNKHVEKIKGTPLYLP